MTENQARQFWTEWLAFRHRWDFRVYPTIDGNVVADFPDKSGIELDTDELGIGDIRRGTTLDVPRPSK